MPFTSALDQRILGDMTAKPHFRAPGPLPLDLLRSIPAIQRNPLAYLSECAKSYGDLTQFEVGRTQVFFINHPDLIRHVLQDNHRGYSKATLQYSQLATITGRGLLTNDGESWLVQRRLIQPAFHRQRLEALADGIVQDTRALSSSWQPGQVVDIDAAMLELTLGIVGKALFSIDLQSQAHSLSEAVLTTLEHIVYKASHFLAAPDSIPTARNLRFRSALLQLDRLVYAMITERRTLQEKLPTAAPDDLLTMLLNARDESTGKGMSDQQVRDEVLTLLIAGHETVASALTWSWALLAQHPAVRREMQRELDSSLNGRLPTASDMSKLTITRQVFEEAIRLYPPAWLITRTATAADELGGYPVPAGSLIIISPYVIHRKAEFWLEPEKFDPTRFRVEHGGAPRYAYIPFGGGPRLCIGDRFAMLEAQLILATISQEWELDLPASEPLEIVPLVTLRPRAGMPMRIQRRKSP